MGKWSESPYIQAFVVLYQNPAWYNSCNLKPGGPEDPPDILYDLPSSPVSQREDPAPPPSDGTLTAPEAPTSPDPSD